MAVRPFPDVEAAGPDLTFESIMAEAQRAMEAQQRKQAAEDAQRELARRPERPPLVGLSGGARSGFQQNVTSDVQAMQQARFDGYRDGDQISLLQRLNTEQVADLQDQMVRLGYMDAKSVRKGTLDVTTVNAFTDVLGIANRQGSVWQTLLRDQQAALDADPTLAFGQEEKPGRLYSTPDTATLKNTVQTRFRSALGRAPTQAEMRFFTEELLADYEDVVDVEKQAVEYSETGRVGVVEEVDPVARFEGLFEERYRPTMDRNEQSDSTTQGAALGQAQAASAARAVGGAS